MLDDKLTNSIFKDLDALISAIELEQMPGGFWVELNVLIRKTNSNAKLIKRKDQKVKIENLVFDPFWIDSVGRKSRFVFRVVKTQDGIEPGQYGTDFPHGITKDDREILNPKSLKQNLDSLINFVNDCENLPILKGKEDLLKSVFQFEKSHTDSYLELNQGKLFFNLSLFNPKSISLGVEDIKALILEGKKLKIW